MPVTFPINRRQYSLIYPKQTSERESIISLRFIFSIFLRVSVINIKRMSDKLRNTETNLSC